MIIMFTGDMDNSGVMPTVAQLRANLETSPPPPLESAANKYLYIYTNCLFTLEFNVKNKQLTGLSQYK